MTDTEALERLAIRDVVERYFVGIDRRDRPLVLSCFTDDAIYEFALEGRVARGRAELEQIFGRADPERSGHTSHGICNTAISVSGAEATADTMALAHLVEGLAGPGRVMIRGLRYRDKLIRQADGWRIVHRIHHSLWQYDAEAVSPDMRQRAGSGFK